MAIITAPPTRRRLLRSTLFKRRLRHGSRRPLIPLEMAFLKPHHRTSCSRPPFFMNSLYFALALGFLACTMFWGALHEHKSDNPRDGKLLLFFGVVMGMIAVAVGILL